MLWYLKAEHSQVQEDVRKTATQLTEVSSVLNELQNLIFDTFLRLGCSQKELENMLGLNVSINVKNVIVYLGQIEQKGNELLNVLHYANLKVGRSTIFTTFSPVFSISLKILFKM